ncbi:hypothetical protein PG984_006200 [Apiospora sp. TS-2023a]
MQLLDLPLDVFKNIVLCMVREQGLRKSMTTRLVCRTFANEVLDAVISTRAFEEIAESPLSLSRVERHYNVIARYLHHRVCTDGPDTHPWITTIRESCDLLVKHAVLLVDPDPKQVERIQFSACLCLAINSSSTVLPVLWGQERNEKTQFEGGTWENALAIASSMGDLTLVESLNRGSDPPSFFGRPSWAAAAFGHLDVSQFFLKQGALPYEPTFHHVTDLVLGETPLGAAAYMGHDDIVQLYLQPPYFCPGVQKEEAKAMFVAAEGNQPRTLRTLLEHRKRTQPQDFLEMLDAALLWSSKRGAPDATRVLLEYGAHPNETDKSPRSCLQHAAIAGDAATVQLLLDAGASLEASPYINKRTVPRLNDRWRKKYKDALTEAKRRNYVAVVRVIEEKQREIGGETKAAEE